MIRPNRDQPLVPAFGVRLNDKQLPKDITAWIVAVSVEDDIDVPSMFAFELVSQEDEHGTAPWTDDPRFSLGAKVALSFGYGDRLETLISGEITALEPFFHSGGPPTLTVRGYDKRHRLNAARRTRTFVGDKDSDIAVKLCDAIGLGIRATDTEVVHPYVLQAGQTDLEFLLERASHIQYELVMDAETLQFRPLSNGSEEILELTFDDDLLDFSPRMSAAPVTQTTLFGWNPIDKEPFESRAKPQEQAGKMGGTRTAAEAARALFAQDETLTIDVEIDAAVASRPEADQLVRARFDAVALDYVRGEGSCRGCTGIRAGTVIKLGGLGERFNGRYYVTSAIHSYTRRDGYTTTFRVRRNEA